MLVSTVKASGSDGVLVLPAGFVSVTVTLLLAGRSAFGWNVQSPFLSAVTDPIGVPLSRIVIRSPAWPLPLIVGRGSSVVPPAGIRPVTGPTASVAPEMTGLTGVLVSTVKASGSDGVLVLPVAGFVSVAVIECGSSDSSFFGWNVQLPFLSTVVEPIGVVVPLSYSVMTSPACPLPLNVGFGSSVTPPAGIRPVIVPTASVAPEMTGLSGADVLTVNANADDGSLFTPARFVSVAVNE